MQIITNHSESNLSTSQVSVINQNGSLWSLPAQMRRYVDAFCGILRYFAILCNNLRHFAIFHDKNSCKKNRTNQIGNLFIVLGVAQGLETI